MSAKDADIFLCPVCHVKVKRKLEKAHNNGRDHRQRVQALKATQEKQKAAERIRLQEEERQREARKRAASDSEDEEPVDSKKGR